MRIDHITYRYFFGWLPILLGGLLAAQGQIYSGSAQLPDGQGTVQVNVQLEFMGESNGVVTLGNGGRAFLYNSSYTVNGLNDAQTREFELKLNFTGLPVSVPTATLKQGRTQFRQRFSLPGTATHTLRVAVSGTLAGTALQFSPQSFSFSKQFNHPDGPAAVVTSEPESDPTPAIVDEPEVVESDRPAEVPTPPQTQNRRTEPPPPPPEPTEAERDFARIGTNEYTHRNYFDDWRGRDNNNQRLLNRALAEIPIASEAQEVDDGYLLIFTYAQDLQLDSIAPDPGLGEMQLLAQDAYRYHLSFPVTAVADYQLFLRDDTKKQELRSLVFSLDNLLRADMTAAEESEKIVLKVGGGQPPYQLFLMREGREYNNLVTNKSYEPEQASYDNSSRTWTIDRAYLGQLVNETGDYQLQLYDATGTATYTIGESVHLVKPRLEFPAWLPYVGGILALLLLWSIFRSRNKARTRERARAELKKMDEGKKTGMAAIKSSREEEAETAPVVAAKAAGGENGGFRISKRARERSLDTFDFRPEKESADFLPLAMDRNWRRSLIEEILFSRKAIFALDSFLRTENTSKVVSRTEGDKWERNEAIPEIGGMLMGQYRQTSTGDYRVSVEQFIPLEARNQNVIKVEIDPLSLARDLGKMQDDHPELTVVGWFHTHPGHGLFLSEPDLKVQLGHFRKPFQFAMEIDSLSEHLDTAFFSYRAEGVVNNREQRIDGSRWFSWSEIEKFTRRTPVS